MCIALIDTGCTRSIVRGNLLGRVSCEKSAVDITTADGNCVKTLGHASGKLEIGGKLMEITCIVMRTLVDDIDIIIGVDIIMRLGGVQLSETGVSFGVNNYVCANVKVVNKCLNIRDDDYNADFDGKKWTVSWKWKNSLPRIMGQVSEYGMSDVVREGFNEEVNAWIDEGILLETADEVEGVIPLMAVVQEHKKKVRPVLNYKYLNEYVSSHTGEAQDCGDTLRTWRSFGDNVAVVDLKRAYLQVHVQKKL